MTKKGEGSHVKESTDSTNTTLEDDDIKGKPIKSSRVSDGVHLIDKYFPC